MAKLRVIKAYDSVEDNIKDQLKLQYPYGFDKYLISFKDTKGKLISALPYEADDRYYLIKMTRSMALDIISNDSDYDDFGHLTDEAREGIMEDLVVDIAEDDDLEGIEEEIDEETEDELEEEFED
jgi:hypothetical protein